MPPPGAAADDADSPERQSIALASMLVEIAAGLIHARYPVLIYTDEVKAEIARKGAAVLTKYSARFDFFAKWREEFEFGAVLGGVIWSSVEVVNAANAARPPSPDAAMPPGQDKKEPAAASG